MTASDRSSWPVYGASAELEVAVRRVIRRIERHKERYLRAWVAATGCDPQQAVLMHWYDGDKQCVRVVHKADSDLRGKLWELLDAGQCTPEAVRDALRLAE